MDFGRLLADPIMEDTVVKQLFFSSRRYGRFSLHSVRCDACAIRLNIAFFHVFWFPTNGIPIPIPIPLGRKKFDVRFFARLEKSEKVREVWSSLGGPHSATNWQRALGFYS